MNVWHRLMNVFCYWSKSTVRELFTSVTVHCYSVHLECSSNTWLFALISILCSGTFPGGIVMTSCSWKIFSLRDRLTNFILCLTASERRWGQWRMSKGRPSSGPFPDNKLLYPSAFQAPAASDSFGRRNRVRLRMTATRRTRIIFKSEIAHNFIRAQYIINRKNDESTMWTC